MARNSEDKQKGYFQVSLMNVFREAAQSRDARESGEEYAEGGDRVLATRTLARRQGAKESHLRQHLAEDMANLMNTTQLGAAEDLEGLDFVKRSVLNFGLEDMSRMTTDDVRRDKVRARLRKSLLEHEPRLIAESLEIVPRLEDDGTDVQRLAFDITAEMAAKPVDVPLEFIAEIDVGSGKIKMSKLTVPR